jgi:hypothetical protein
MHKYNLYILLCLYYLQVVIINFLENDKVKNVTAVFVKKQYPLTIEIEGEGTVIIKIDNEGFYVKTSDNVVKVIEYEYDDIIIIGDKLETK